NVATVLGHTDSARIEADRPFTELGFDSLTAIELRNKLSNETKLKIPATATFDYPTPRQLSLHLWAGIGEQQDAAPRLAAQIQSLTASFMSRMHEISADERVLIKNALRQMSDQLSQEDSHADLGESDTEIDSANSVSEILRLIEDKIL
ncbi:acyl carrier protein, partial [Nocardia abscessus]|uniref:acyl carrier protein n=1 Tax=Nocardia abscessus TaxID=120957 RepID=UPI0024537800